jgi:hypothetical protein
MDSINFTISASTVAWYAAIVSTVGVIIALTSAIIAFLNYRADKRRLKVSISRGFLTGLGDDSTKLIFNAANIGKRPVTIQGVGLSLKGKTNLIIMNTPMLKLPHTIKEGDSAQTWSDHAELIEQLKQSKKTIRDVKTVWFRDSTGKVYSRKTKLKW